jgi:hypothetical protein
MAKASRVDNTDIVPFALYQLGGAGEFFDVEEIFDACYKIAPERFRWRKFDYPNYKTLYHALRDFEGKNPNIMIKTADGLGRQLSAEGVEWVRLRLPLFEQVLAEPGANPPTRRTGQKLLNELRDHPVVQSFLEGSSPTLAKHQAADLLLCSPDSPRSVWNERLQTYRAAAAGSNRPDLARFLDFLESQQPSWFRKE